MFHQSQDHKDRPDKGLQEAHNPHTEGSSLPNEVNSRTDEAEAVEGIYAAIAIYNLFLFMTYLRHRILLLFVLRDIRKPSILDAVIKQLQFSEMLVIAS